RSGLPSPSRSAAATEMGPVPVTKVTWLAKVGAPPGLAIVLRSTLTVALEALTTARSGLPSPSRSAADTEYGNEPVAKVTWAAKVGALPGLAVVLRSTLTVLLPALATARSSLPSPSRSAAVTENGL